MEPNPYTPPQAQALLPARATQFGEPQPWDPVEVLQTAWTRGKPHLGVLIVATLIAGAGQYVFSIVKQMAGMLRKESPEAAFAIMGVALLANLLFYAFCQVGLCRMALSVARGRPPTFGDVFSGGDRFGVFVEASLLAGLGIAFRCIALIIPGILLALAYSQVTPLVADTSMGVTELLGTSARITRGQRGKIFAYWLACMGATLVGFLACCVGALVVAPVVHVASAIVYLRLTGQDELAREPHDNWGQPPPGYGPPGYGPYGA